MCSCTYESYESGTCPCLDSNYNYRIINPDPAPYIISMISIAIIVYLLVGGIIVGKSTPKSNPTPTDPYDDELDGI